MHYYSFNIADYRKDTGHLTIVEHYIYRSLMDWYYLDEQPIPRITQQVTRRLRLGSENEPELANVLNDFFIKEENGWVHKRIEGELDKYAKKAEQSRRNGLLGGRHKKQRVTDAKNPEVTQQEPSTTLTPPLTNNHKPITNIKRASKKAFKPPSVKEVSDYCKSKGNNISPDSFVDFYEGNGWMRGKTKIKDWKACVRTWESRERKDKPDDDLGVYL